MHICPHCSFEIHLKELPYQGFAKSHRRCSECGGYFTADAKTKRRQALFLFILIISTALTILLYLNGTKWLIPATISYVICGTIFYIGNKRIFFVPYQKNRKTADDT
jgi:uncharacterized protein (DUF983 family)